MTTNFEASARASGFCRRPPASDSAPPSAELLANWRPDARVNVIISLIGKNDK